MAQSIKVQVESGKSGSKKSYDITQGAGDRGEPTRINAVNSAKYKLEDAANKGRAPSNISTKRIGRDLHVILDGSNDADLIIEGYYDEATPKEERGSLYGTGENGSAYEYIPEDASSKGLIADLQEGGKPISQVLGSSGVASSGAGAGAGAGAAAGGAAAGAAAGFSWLTVAASMIGAAAIAGGGKGSSSSSSNNNTNTGVTPAAPTYSPSLGGGANDTGASATDGITKNNKPGFDVGVVPAGTEPQLVVDGKVVPSRKTGPDSNGHYTLTPVDPISDGKHDISINYKDTTSGKTSGSGPTVTVVVDTSVPELTISKVSDDDAINAAEAQGAITVNGTTRAEAGQEVTVKLRDSSGVLHTYFTKVVAGVNGAANTYSIQIPQTDLPVTDGSYTVTADVENVAGTAATTATHTIKLDTVAPVLHITSISGDTVNDSNALAGTFDVPERGLINTTTVTTPPVISGTTDAEAGQVVTVTLNNTSHTTTVQTGGTWSLTLSNADALALNHGNTYNVSATVTDAAGNLGSDINNSLIVNIAPPDIPTIVEKYSGNTTPVLTGTAEKEDPAHAGQYLKLTSGDTMVVTINHVALNVTIGSEPTGFTYNTSTGVWTLDTGAVANSFNLQDNQTYDVSIDVTAGNATKHDVSSNELHIRTALPTITLDPVSADNFINKFDHDNGVIITGSTDAEVGSVVTLTGLDGTSRTATVVAGVGGAHVFNMQISATDVAQFTNTSHTAQASVVNKYGQTASATQTVEVDFTPPTVTITMDDTALKTGDTSTVTFTFNETPSNFALNDIDVAGAQGTLTNLVQSNADPKVWTATFTPTTNIEDTSNVISVLANSYNDPAGNGGLVGNSANFTIDTKAPTVTITLSDSALTNTDTSTVTFTFNETPDAASFTLADIDVSGAQGTVSNLLQDSNDPKVWTATFTPSANTDDSTNVIRLAAGSYTDAAGNSGTAGSSANFTIDTMPPNSGNAPVVSIVADTSNDGTISYAENNSAYVEVAGVPVLTVTASFDNTKVAVGDTITFTPNSGSAATVTLTQPMITAGVASTTFARPADGGTLSVSAIITDAGSNSTPAGTDSALIDLTNSNFSATVDITGMTTDSGVSSSDFVTVDHTLTYSGTVTNFTNNGDRVKLELLASDGTTVIATQIVTPVSGAWSWAYETTQADGQYSLRATIIDVTGAAINPSSPVTDTQAILIDSSGTKKDDGVTDDVNVNATISITSIDDGLSGTTSATGSKDTGTSVADFVTNDTSLSIYGVTSGFDASEGAQVQVQIYNGSTLVVEQYVVPDNAGKWVFNNTASTLTSGTYTLKAHIVDKAGNVTKDAPDQTLLIDASGSTNQPGSVNDPNASATITVLRIHDTANGSQDTGPSSTDFITSDNTLIIKGSTTGYTHAGATAGDQLRVQITNSQGAVVLTQYVTPDSSGNWSVDNRANVMADGKYTISTSIFDLAGNPVKTGASQDLIISTKKGGSEPGYNPVTAPLVDDNATNATLAITAISDDTGYSSTDFITADGTLTISGSIGNFVSTGGAAGDKLRVQILKADGTVAAVHYVTPTGNTWSINNTASTLADGNYTIKAAIVDAADNVVKAAPEQALVVSATAVTSTSAVSIGAISTDTGVSVIDFVTNDNTLTVKGATSGFNSTTQKLLVKIIKVSDSSEAASDFATVANDGTWTLDNTTQTLADGSYTIRAVVTNLAGTVEVASTITTHSLVIDTAGTGSANTSATIAVTSIHDAGKDSLDTGVSSTDFITSDSTLIIKGSITGFARTGTAAGDKVRVQILDASSHVIAQQYLTPDGAGVWAMNNQANVLADGTYSIQADIVDLADNVVKAGTPKALVIDTNLGNTGNNGSNANASTVVAITSISDDTGYNTTDFVTADTALVINGTATGFTTAGSSANDKVHVQVIRADGAVLVDQYVLPNGSGAWTLSNTANALLDGNYTIKAAVVNAAGNPVSVAPDQALVISSGNTPTQATLAITSISDDAGPSATDFITNDTTLTVTGTTTNYVPASGDVVLVQIIKASDGSVVSSGYVTPASNAWSFTTSTLASDLYSIRAVYATAAHVENSNPVTQRLVVDNSGPNSPGNNPGTDPNSDTSVVIAFSGITNDTGVNTTDYVTYDNTLVISGHIDNFSSSNGGEGDMVRVEIINSDSSHSGDRVAYVAVDSSGNWSLDNTANTLVDGTYTLKAAIVDAADNVVKAAADKTLVINHSSLPTVTASISGVADDVTPLVGSLAYAATTNDTTPVVSGTISGSLGANQSVYIYDDATCIGTATVTGTNWTFSDPRTLVNGQRIRYIAQVQDLAGNPTTASSDFVITIDTSGPAPIGVNDDPLHPPAGTTSLVFSVTADNVVNIAEAAAANTPVVGNAYGDYTAGDVITITVNGNNYSGTLAANGSFSINVPGADLVADPDSTVEASLVAHDKAGIAGTITATKTYTFDNTVPTTTVAISSISQDTGSSSTDFITSDNNGIAISGTLSQPLLFGEKVWYSNDNGVTWTNITNGVSSTNVSYFDAALTSTRTIQMRVGDAADNYSTAATQLVTIDTTGPSPIGVNDDPLNPPAGTTSLVLSVTADNVVNTAEGASTSAITGTARGDFTTGDVVTLTVNAHNYSSTLAADGTFSINVAGSDLLADTDTTVAASLAAHDRGGNPGTVTVNKAYTIDTSAPATTVSISGISTDTGSSSTDFITTDNNGLTITAVLSQALTGGEKLWYSHDNGSTWTDITSSTSGTGVSHIDSALTATATIKMRVGDASDNYSAVASQLVTIDTTGPSPIGVNDDPLNPPAGTTSLVLSVTPDNTINATEGAGTPAITGTARGDFTTGDVVTLTVNGHAFSGTLAADGTFSINVAGSDLLADVSVAASLAAHDRGGNPGTITTTKSYTIDTTAPSTTVTLGGISQDTGSSSTDFITTDNNGLTITASLNQSLASGEKLWYSNDNGTSWINITSSVTGTGVSYADSALTSTNTIKLRVGDAADNYSAVVSQLVTIDTTGPSPLVNGDDPLNPPAGKTSLVFDVTADNVINSAEGTGTTPIAGRAYGDFTTGDVVTLTVNAHNYSGTLAADGTFSIGVAGADLLADTDTTVAASLAAHDRGGNPGTITATKAYTIDTSAPATTVSISGISTDTGSSSTDFITSDNNGLTITAALSQGLASGEKLWYSNNNGSTWTDITSSASGTAVSHTDSTLTATNTIKLRVGDASNNYSAVASQLITIDTSGPAPIGPNDDPLHPPAGTTSLVFNVTDDNIINAAEGAGTPAITGTARGDYTTGDVVTLTINTHTFSGTLAADGTFSINVSGADLLADADTTVAASLVAHDKGGVAGTITANKSYGIDTAAPSTTVAISGISLDTGANTNDYITNDSNGLTVTGTLNQSLAGGEKLWYSHDNGATWVDITSSVNTTNVSYVDNALTSTNTIKMRVGDTANNFSAVASQLVTIDTTGPSPIGVNDDPLNPPAGTTSLVLDAVTADNVINSTEAAGNVNITGTVRGEFTTGDIVTLVVNSASYTGQVLANGTFSIAVAGTNLAGDVDRSISASVTAHDSANNSGIVTVSKTYTVDIVAPTTSVAIDAISLDSGFDGTDFITSDNNGLTITGTLTQGLIAGEKLWYSNDNGSTWTDITTSASGTAVSHIDSTLTATNTIKMRVGDAADNFSAVASQLVTIDAAAPTTTATISTIVDDVGTVQGTVLTGGSTDDNNLSLTGTLSANLAAGQAVRIYDNGTLIGTAVSAVGSNSWTYADNRNLAHNTLVKYTAKVESIAGILTAASNEYTATIRTNVPTITIGSIAANSVTATSDGTYDANERGVNPTTAASLPVISGSSVDVEEGQIVSVTVNNTNYTAAVQADGTWSASLTNAGAIGLNYGNYYNVSASVTDKAGRTVIDSNNRLYADTASPNIPSIVNNKSGTTTPTLTGLAMKEDPSNPGTYLVLSGADTLSITINGVTLSGTISSLPSGLTYNAGTHTWSLNTAAFNLQDHTTYDVAVTVVAGSVTEHDNSTNELSINTTAPTVTLDAISTDGYLNAVESGQTLSVTGTTDAEIGSVVTLTGLDGISRTAAVAAGAGNTRVFTFNIASSDVGAFTAGNKTASATVVNAFGLSGTDTETLVVDTTGPSFTSSTTATAVNENIASGSAVYTAVTTDAHAVQYSLKTATGDVGKFTINASTGVVSIAESPNYEVKDSYTFTVVATDAAGNTTEQAVSLAVNNLDEVAPTITSGSTASAITENTATGAAVYTATALDTDFNSPNTASSITYSLKPATGDVGKFSINASTGVVTLTESPNYETKPSYTFTVVATDAAGNASEKAVTLAVTNVDEVAPTFTSSATATSVDENVLSGTVVYTAAATDTDFNAPNTANSVTYSLKPATGDVARFGINANTGVVTLNEVPDFEVKPSYTFTVIATDAAGNTREQAVSLAVSNINEAPVVTPDLGTHSYTEQLTPVVVNAGITLADVDSTSLTGATISITNGFTAGDVLAFTNANGISGSYNASTGVLTLSGTATVAQYQAALQSVTYSSTSDGPTVNSLTRIVSWQVDDGASSNHASNVGTSIINITEVNDAPVVTPDVATHTYTEAGAAVVANSALTVTDADSANLSGATVTISAGKTAGDELAFTNANGITGSYDSTTGVLTLSGVATKAQYQTALRSVTFNNTGADPAITSATRTLSWQVDDGGSANNTSNVGTSTINITAVNDAPVINASTTVTLNTLLEDSGVPSGVTGTAVSDLFAAITDADSANAKGIAITSVNGNGTLYYSTDAGTTWTLVTGTLADSNALLLSGANRVYFKPNANWNGAIANAFLYRAWDQTNGATPGTKVGVGSMSASWAYSSVVGQVGITVGAVNDAPVFTATAINSVSGSPSTTPVSVFSGTTASMGATNESTQKFIKLGLTVSGLLDGSAETLNVDGSTVALVAGSGTTATNGLAYTVAVNAGVATVTLTKVAGVTSAALVTLVDGMTYANTNADPTSGSRVLTLTTVQDSGTTADGGVDTTALSVASTINITPNTAPVATSTAIFSTYTLPSTPKVVITDNNSSNVVDPDTVVTYNLTFSEAIDASSLTESDIAITNGSIVAGSFTRVGTSNVWTIGVKAPSTGGGTTVVSLADGAYTSASGVSGKGASGTQAYIKVTPVAGPAIETGMGWVSGRLTTDTNYSGYTPIDQESVTNLNGTSLNGPTYMQLTGSSYYNNATNSITGLVVGETYTYGVQWQQETRHYKTGDGSGGYWDYWQEGGQLNIKIGTNGVNQTYTSSDGLGDGWQTAIYTFTATATSMSVVLAVSGGSGNYVPAGAIAVDSLTIAQVNTAVIPTAIVQTGTSGADAIYSGDFADTITAAGGADTIYTGAGDDKVILNESNATDLSGATATLIDGGMGVNFLQVVNASAAATLDLTNATVMSRLKNFSSIDLTGSQNNTLKINWSAISNISGTTDNVATSGVDESKMLVVSGNASDALQLANLSNWIVGSAQTAASLTTTYGSSYQFLSGHSYKAYTLSSTTLFVDDAITTTNLVLTTTTNSATVSSMFGALFTDAQDASHAGTQVLKGVAITFAGATADLTSKGKYQLSADNGITWTDVAADLTDSTAVFAASNALIRFVGVAGSDVVTPPPMTVRLVDSSGRTGTGSLVTGNTVDAHINGGITAFSGNAITVSRMNQAPVSTDADGLLVADPLGTATSNITTSKTVGVLFGANFSDQDYDAFKGVAVTFAGSTADLASMGKFQYSSNGTTWTDLPAGLTEATAVFLNKADSIRFYTTAANATLSYKPDLTVRLVDTSSAGTSGSLTSGATVDVSGANHGGATAISDATLMLAQSANHAPVLADTTLAFANVTNEGTAPSGAVGVLVSSLMGGVTDADTGATKGIAITGVDTTKGSLWVSTNGGTTWTNITTTLSDTNAYCLASDADNRVYFQPTAAVMPGTSTTAITFRAWDATTGTEGTYANTAISGGHTAFSATTDTLNQKITPAAINLSMVAAGTGGFVINGAAAGDQAGLGINNAGDINGDGIDDIIIGARYSDVLSEDAGRAFVVFGKTGANTAIDLSAIIAGNGGFVINSEAQWDHMGISVSALGDINGDGLADVVVGTLYGDGDGLHDSGRAYVIFGKTSTSAVNLSAVTNGTGGFAIDGQAVDDRLGAAVAGVGDMNGDGFGDIVIGSYVNDASGSETGRAYVVFGKTDSSRVFVSSLSSGTGYVINAEALTYSYTGTVVSNAGDVNGDGLADVLVGASGSNRNYVVFGKTGNATTNLSAVAGGTGGFLILGGDAMAGGHMNYFEDAGDVNGDGLADVILGAIFADPAAGGDAGRAYVVFGKTSGTAINLSAILAGSGGFAMNGTLGNDQTGWTATSAGDFNGDGLADLIVGARYGDVGSTSAGWDAGRTFVVYGKTNGTAIDLSAVAKGSGGFVINGQGQADESGSSASYAGDLNGDGYADLLVGAYKADAAAGTDAGKSYVIYGGSQYITGNVALATGTSADELVVGSLGADVLVGNGGIDRFSAGAGNDTIVLGVSDITNLADVSTSATQHAYVSGGEGVDTLRLKDGASLNLTTISNVSGAAADGASRINSIERIDMATDTAANTFTLTAKDVADMSPMMNQFNSGNGWVGLGFMVQRHQLVVDGTSADTLALPLASSEVWALAGTATNGGKTYNIYNCNTSAVQLLVDNTIQQTVPRALPVIGLNEVATGFGGFAINGLSATEMAGLSISNAGDINGDGFDDLIVGTPESDAFGGNGGRTYVVFGKSGNVPVDLSAVVAGSGGFVINPLAGDEGSGVSVSGAGDVNGDGLADLITGAMWSDVGAVDAGRAYVIFGKTSTSAVSLTAIDAGSGGYAINGSGGDSRYGISVSGAGDVNGDGLSDLVIGGSMADAATTDAGKSYVLFGKTSTSAVDLSTVTWVSGGFLINGNGAGTENGTSVSNAGDVNGDGLADVIVSDSGTATPRSYVVFGKTSGAWTDLSAIAGGTGGFAIAGQEVKAAGLGLQFANTQVSSAGDVNGDGLADLIVGSYYTDAATGVDSGRAFVVFGKTTGATVNLSAVLAGSGGFAINGQAAGDQLGLSVSGAGDINGDGLADVIVGAAYSDPKTGLDSGRTYVVFGKTGTAAIDLTGITQGLGGFVINGQAVSDYSGYAVSSAGDVNGDGYSDLLISAPFNDVAGATNVGRTYVLFGSSAFVTGNVALATGTAASERVVGTAGADTLVGNGGVDCFSAGAGNDTISVSSADVTNLADVSTATSLHAYVNGGTGLDTLRLISGATLDLTAITNVSGAAADGASRINSIEHIDMATDTTSNSTVLRLNDVIDMSADNVFNSSNTTAVSGTAIGAAVAKHQLMLTGGAEDFANVNLAADWTNTTTVVSYNAHNYAVYNATNGAAVQLLIDQAMLTANHVS